MKLGTDDNGETTITIRQSDINTFLMCPEQHRLKANGLVADRDTDAAVVGTATHAGIDATLGEGASRTEAIDVIAWTLDEYLERDSFTWTKLTSVDQMYDQAMACYDAWFDHIRPNLPAVIATEQFFSVPFTTLTVKRKPVHVILEGTMDLVSEDGPWDWKTSASPYQSWEKERFAVQPTVYSFACAELGHPNPTLFTYGIMIRGKDPADPKATQLLAVRRGERHWAWLREQIEPLVHLTLAKLPVWPKNDQGWHCAGTWCPAWAAGQCKGSHANGEVHLT